jgi:hypothetical protein
MHEAEKVLDMIIKARRHAAKVLQPRPEPLDLPTTTVTAQSAPVLCRRLDPVRLVRRDHLDAPARQFSIERVAVISLVADQPLRKLSGKTLSENISDKGDFMRRSTRRVGGERKTMSVCHTHEFRAFAPLGGAHSAPPFLATANVPSIKHSVKSISPRSCRSRAKASSTARSVPSLDHCWNLRWHVWYGGNLSGKSCHRAPLRSIQRTPLMTSRVSLHGLPRLSSRRGGSGISGAKRAHCSSVNSSPRAMRKC